MLFIGCILERGGEEEKCFLLQGIVGAKNRFYCSTIITEPSQRTDDFFSWVLPSCHFVVAVKSRVLSFRGFFLSLYSDFQISCKCKFMIFRRFLTSVVKALSTLWPSGLIWDAQEEVMICSQWN